MDAIVNGVVEVDVDAGCVWLSTADGSRHPVLWPFGTEAEGDPPHEEREGEHDASPWHLQAVTGD